MSEPLFPPINIDDMSDDEGDLIEAADVLYLLSRYVRLKARAMAKRREGDIAYAESMECRMDRLYCTLPDWARW